MEKQITLTNLTLNHLENTRKWTLFISIAGFIFIGLLIFLAFGMGAMMDSMDDTLPFAELAGPIMTVFYLILAALYLYPIYHLYRFSSKMKEGIRTKEEQTIETAFRSLKAHYTFLGVLTAIMVGIYVLFFLIGMVGSFGATAFS